MWDFCMQQVSEMVFQNYCQWRFNVTYLEATKAVSLISISSLANIPQIQVLKLMPSAQPDVVEGGDSAPEVEQWGIEDDGGAVMDCLASHLSSCVLWSFHAVAFSALMD